MKVGPAMIRSRVMTLNDRYLQLLALALLGYALAGKGFAYVGIPPLFIGEIVYLLGIVAFIATGCWVAVLASLPALMLALLMGLVIIRTIPYVGTHGLDAARDAVVVLYGGFAFVVTALLLEQPDRIRTILRYLRLMMIIYVPLVLAIYYLPRVAGHLLPLWSPTGVPRAGEIGVHLGAAALLALLGLVKVGRFWFVSLLLGIATVGAQSRGGLLACLIPIFVVALIDGRVRELASVSVVLAAVLAISALADLKINVGPGLSPEDPRNISSQQIVRNIVSIAGQSDGALDGTKAFRLNWWSAIQDYTFNGPYYWTGKGFGVNLAESDGIRVAESKDAPPLRSPHNAHMTILARTGIPGLALWVATGAAWFYTLARCTLRARRRQERMWANTFLFLMGYVAAIIIDATFDVALEGPILGIWFWCLIGAGIGSSMIFNAMFERAGAVSEHSLREPHAGARWNTG